MSGDEAHLGAPTCDSLRAMVPDLRLLLAGGAGDSLLGQQIGVCLIAAALLAVAFERVRLPSAPALLIGGFLVGPNALGFVSDQGDVTTIANLGLTFLLFVIGLELDFRSLAKSGRSLALSGALQVPLTTGLAFGVFYLLQKLGVLPGDFYVPLYLAFACAFSSTLLVAKALAQRYQVDTQDGRLCLGLLIFQDIWAVLLLAVQPSFASPDALVIISTLSGIILLALLAVLFTRFVLPALFGTVAKFPELLVLLALGWCFGLGVLGSHLDAIAALAGIEAPIQVSMEMGALIAGASIASFPYAHEVVGKVANLRDFFVTLFFAAIGMSIPIPDGFGPIAFAGLLVLVLLTTRAVVFFPLFAAGGVSRRNAFTSSAKMAQVSEFALVVAHLGVALGHIKEDTQSIASFAFVFMAFITSLSFDYSDSLYARLASRLGFLRDPEDATTQSDGHGDEKPARLVLLGFHRLASSLLSEIQSQAPQIADDVLVIDLNLALHDRIRERGVKVQYGDLSNPESLAHAPIADDAVIITTVPDDLLRGVTNARLVKGLREMYPQARIFAVALSPGDVAEIRESGADFVYTWQMEAAISLLPVILAGANGQLGDATSEREHLRGPLEQRDEVL